MYVTGPFLVRRTSVVDGPAGVVSLSQRPKPGAQEPGSTQKSAVVPQYPYLYQLLCCMIRGKVNEAGDVPA